MVSTAEYYLLVGVMHLFTCHVLRPLTPPLLASDDAEWMKGDWESDRRCFEPRRNARVRQVNWQFFNRTNK